MGRRITVYLDSGVKRRLERVAQEQNTNEATILREAIERETLPARRRVPYLGIVEGDPDLSSRVDEILKTSVRRAT